MEDEPQDTDDGNRETDTVLQWARTRVKYKHADMIANARTQPLRPISKTTHS